MKIHRSDFVKYSTLEGKDGWLFIWDMDGVTEIITGQTRHSVDQLRLETRNIELREAWCRSRGITYVHTIAPDKASIYPEHLPEAVTYDPTGLLTQFSDALASRDVTFIDLRPLLTGLKPEMQVYFKTDSHWTYSAAYRALCAIMAPITARFPAAEVLAEAALNAAVKSKVMELSAITDAPVVESFQILAPKAKTVQAAFQTNSSRGRIQVFRQDQPDLPSAIVFRDSFSSFFLPILCESFSQVIVLNSRVFWYDLVEAAKPDVVIMEVAERYLDPLTTDLGLKSFGATFGIEIDEILQNWTKA